MKEIKNKKMVRKSRKAKKRVEEIVQKEKHIKKDIPVKHLLDLPVFV